MAVGALGRPPGAPRGRLVAPAMAPRDRLSVLSKLLTQIWPYPLFFDRFAGSDCNALHRPIHGMMPVGPIQSSAWF